MSYSVYPLGPLETNSYLVYKDGQAVVIDAGGDPAPILHDLRAKGLTLAAIYDEQGRVLAGALVRELF